MKSRTEETLRYVQFLARRFDKRNVNAVTLLILYDLGFTPSMDGFEYLRAAIEGHLTRRSPFIIKGIYPSITSIQDDDDSWQYIDQAIRRAIKAAWDTREYELWERFIPFSSRKKAKCPSNKEFIARISCIIELWQGCKEADYDRAI